MVSTDVVEVLGGHRVSPLFSLGAFLFVVLPVIAAADCLDADGDRDTDLLDFRQMQICFGGVEDRLVHPCCEALDANGNAAIGEEDVAAFTLAIGGPAAPFPIVKKLDGLNFSAYLDGQDPNRGDHVTKEQVEQRLAIIAPYTNGIRIFSTTNGHQHVCKPARAAGLKIAVGAWIGRDADANKAEIAGLIKLAAAGCVDVAIVGSEVLLRGDANEDELLSYIGQVKAALPDEIPVSTAEVYGVLLGHPRIIEACDVLMVNFYAYWEGRPIEAAIDSLDAQYHDMVAIACGKPVIVSETGWPSCGNTIGGAPPCTNTEAIPSPENARAYLQEFVSWAEAEDSQYFYFEAFDETWKARYEGPQGACWGLWGECGQLKPWACETFSEETVSGSKHDEQAVRAGAPSIEFTNVPQYGSCLNLRGQVQDVDPSEYAVAMYIKVAGCWWTKPTFAQSLTRVWSCGSFVCDITTGGIDQSATHIRAYLVPINYTPPAASCLSNLPAKLDEIAIASVEAVRTP